MNNYTATKKICPRTKNAALAAAVFFQTYSMSAFANSPEIPDEPIAWISLLMPMVLILGAAAAATFALRRWKRAVGGRDGPLQLIHIIALGPRERLALVKVGTHYLVVGITPNNINRIAELSDMGSELSDKQNAGTVPSPAQSSGADDRH
jgi:flagellar biosynthetic protein FliO